MEKMSREEAVQYLTMMRDLMVDTTSKEQAIELLRAAGETVGYTPAFRCLVKGLESEESIRWGK